jgi:hypothetical protein
VSVERLVIALSAVSAFRDFGLLCKGLRLNRTREFGESSPNSRVRFKRTLRQSV